MQNASDVYVLSATRTAIGKYGGGLAAVPPCDLAATVVREAVSRAGVEPDDGRPRGLRQCDPHRGTGHVPGPGGRGQRRACRVQTPAFTVNRLCGSGLQAIVSAAQAVRLGDSDVAVAGGAESMSRGQYWLPVLRWGQRMQDGIVVDADGRRAHRPLRLLPHGRHRGERRRRVRRLPGRSGRAGRGEPPPRGRRAPRRGTSRSRSRRSRCRPARAR